LYFSHCFVNQSYLGRCVVWAVRDGDVDMMEMTEGEKEEFFALGKALKEALITAFGACRINYSNLQNTEHHLHFHFIPRYSTPKTFLGHVFVDEKHGRNYAPEPPCNLDRATILGIKDHLQLEFTKQCEKYNVKAT